MFCCISCHYNKDFLELELELIRVSLFILKNHKKCACDFINQSEDTKLRELLNVKPKYKAEDKAKATKEICNYTRSIYFITDKQVNI